MMSDRRFWLGWAVALAVLTAAAAWGISQWNLARYSQLVADRLVLLGELRRGALQGYLDTASSELRFWSTSPGLSKMTLHTLGNCAGPILRTIPTHRDSVPNCCRQRAATTACCTQSCTRWPASS